MLQVLFFARTRDELGCSALDVAWAEEVASLDALQEQLCNEHGEHWRHVLEQDNMIRAVNHTVVDGDCSLEDGDEIAFFRRLRGADALAELFVSIQQADFDTAALQRQLLAGAHEEGAVASFTGYVRASNMQRKVHTMELEHYPGMTETSIREILQESAKRWPLLAAAVVHRVGRLGPGDQIVWVGAASAHREAAFSACEFLMDYLKTKAPFWKKELGPEGEHWVDARSMDDERASRWQVHDD